MIRLFKNILVVVYSVSHDNSLIFATGYRNHANLIYTDMPSTATLADSLSTHQV